MNTQTNTFCCPHCDVILTDVLQNNGGTWSGQCPRCGESILEEMIGSVGEPDADTIPVDGNPRPTQSGTVATVDHEDLQQIWGEVEKRSDASMTMKWHSDAFVSNEDFATLEQVIPPGVGRVCEHATKQTMDIEPDSFGMSDSKLADSKELTQRAAEADTQSDDADANNRVSLSVRKRSLSRPDEDFTVGETDYELINVLGEGGMGVVYAARQASIDRSVAVKMIKTAAVEQKHVSGFMSEAVITGELDHPNIVPIYDLGMDEAGAVFYSMKQVEGTPWNKVVEEKTEAENLDILLRVADAIAFAHSRGVVHCDLKPENIMLGDYGETLVMDWGLAQLTPEFRKPKSIAKSAGGGGTPAYMAPEMAEGKPERIGVHSDVYLLGAILFEIVTGTAPHTGNSVMACLMNAARNVIRETDEQGELLDIAYRAMSTIPSDRYLSVQDFQAAIRDYLSHSESLRLTDRAEEEFQKAVWTSDYRIFSQSLAAFREALSLWEDNDDARLGMNEAEFEYATCAFNKGDYDLALSMLDAEDSEKHADLRAEIVEAQTERDARKLRLKRMKRVAVWMGVSVVGCAIVAAVWINEARKDADDQRAIAVDQARVATEQTEIAKEQTALAVQEKAAADEARGRAEAEKKAAEEQRQLAVTAKQKAETERQRAENEKKIAEQERQRAENEKKIAEQERTRAEQEKQRAETQEKFAKQEQKRAEEQKQLAEQEREKAKMEQRKAERATAAATAAQKLEEQAKIAAVAAQKEAVRAQKEAVASKEAEAYEGYVARIQLASQMIEENAFDTARRLLKECLPQNGEKDYRGWEWARLMYLCTLENRRINFDGPVNAVNFNREGTQFVTASWDGKAAVWNQNQKAAALVLPHGGLYVHDATFSPNGQVIATASNDPDGFVQLWDAVSGKRIKTLDGHEEAVLSVAFSPDGEKLLTSSYDNTARLWDLATGKQLQKFHGHFWWVWTAEFSPDGKRIVTASQDGSAIVWSIEGERLAEFTGHRGPVFTAKFAADGRRIVTGGHDGRVLVWNPADQPKRSLKKMLKAGVNNEPVFTALDGHTAAVRSISISQDGRQVLSGSDDNTLRLWNSESGRCLQTFRGHDGWVRCAAISPDGQSLLSGSQDQQVREWLLSSYEETRVFSGRLLKGHSEAILSADFAPDGNSLITASRDRTARIWSTKDGKPLKSFSEGHAFLPMQAVFSPNGQWLFTAAFDNTVRVWNVANGTEVARLEHTGRNAALAVSSGGNWLLTGSDDRTAKLWNITEFSRDPKFSEGSASSTWTPQIILEDHHRPVTSAAFSADDRYILTGDDKGHARLWDAATGKLLHRLEGHSRRINAAAFTPDGKRALTASDDNTVAQWNVATGEEDRTRILKHTAAVTSFAITADGEFAITACDDGQVRTWNLSTAQVIDTLPLAGTKIQSLALSPDGRWLLGLGSGFGQTILWDRQLKRDVSAVVAAGRAFPLPKSSALWSATFSPDSRRVVTVGGNEVRMWDVRGREELISFNPNGTVATARFSPDGRRMVTASWDGAARIWNTRTGKAVLKLNGVHTADVNSAEFSPNGKFVATAGDIIAALWDADTGSVIRKFTGHTARVRSAKFSADGRWIVTASDDRTARVWETATGRELTVLEGHRWSVNTAQFSRDGRHVVTASDDITARVWKLIPGDTWTVENVAVLSNHTAAVTSAAFSPDGKRVLTGSRDDTVKVWDPATGKELLTLKGHAQDVTDARFSPNGESILTASRDGTAILWLATSNFDQRITLRPRPVLIIHPGRPRPSEARTLQRVVERLRWGQRRVKN